MRLGIVSMILAGLLAVASGCSSDKGGCCGSKGTAAHAHEMTASAPAAAATVPSAATEPEQKTCPVMGGAIDKQYSTLYKGKTVYFCCPMCKPEFEKNPEKYLAKLPQFGGK